MTIKVHNNNLSLTWDCEALVSDMMHNFNHEYYSMMHPELDNFTKRVRAEWLDRAIKGTQDKAQRYITYLNFCIENRAFSPWNNQPRSIHGIINMLHDAMKHELTGDMEKCEKFLTRVNQFYVEYTVGL